MTLRGVEEGGGLPIYVFPQNYETSCISKVRYFASKFLKFGKLKGDLSGETQ